MWQRTAILMATLTLGGVTVGTAQGYDYIQGDDVFEEGYDYGLDYEGLTSVPDSRLRSSSPARETDNAERRLKHDNDTLQRDTTQPSMTRELDRWRGDRQLTPPALNESEEAP